MSTSDRVIELIIVIVSIAVVKWILDNRTVKKTSESFEYTDYQEIEQVTLPQPEVTYSQLEVTYTSPTPHLASNIGEVDVTLGDLHLTLPDLDVTLGEVRLPKVTYTSPRTDLLNKGSQVKINDREIEVNKKALLEKLAEYNIDIKSIAAVVGPSITLYKLLPASGVKVSSIVNLKDDLALALSCAAVMVYHIPNDNKIGVEVPNRSPQVVTAREVFESEIFTKCNYELPVCLGKLVDGKVKLIDLSVAPHLLIAGATGKGKSVGINMLIASLLFKKHPESLKFVMIDPKRVELSVFENIHRQFLLNVTDDTNSIITDVTLAQEALEKLCLIMDERYDILKKNSVRNIIEYNAKAKKKLQYIVVVIDELADLIMVAGKGIEAPLCRLAQLARAIGIHLIVATQRPSSKIITGDIKTNFPSRLSFQVSSGIDSKIIIDTVGAENLIGRGDSLFSESGGKLERIQCAFIDTKEVNRLVDFISKQPVCTYQKEEQNSVVFEPKIEEEKRDSLADKAIRICRENGRCNISLLKRKLNIGDTRAARIIEQIQDEWDT